MNDKRSTPSGFRARVHEIIFEADTPAGRAFDVALIVCILASALGKTISVFLMILGYGIIAVPTGIVSVELSTAARLSVKTTACPNCSHGEHDDDAQFCKLCGTAL